MFMKHIGKHNNKKIVILYRAVPGEDHACLVCFSESLPTVIHDALMKVVESEQAQNEDELSEVLNKNYLPDGRIILQALHREGFIKKVPTAQVMVTPNSTSHVKLDELNRILNEIKAGGEAARKLSDLDKNSGLIDPALRKQLNETKQALANVNDVVGTALDDTALARNFLSQSEKMEMEAKSLLAESERLKQQAYELNPALNPVQVKEKPRKPRKKKEVEMV